MRPPTTPRSNFWRAVYTSTQRFPGPTSAVFLSAETSTFLKFSIETVIPPSIFEAPLKAAWPPPFTAKGHCVKRDNRTREDTSMVDVGLKTQRGLTAACIADQYAPVKASYIDDSSVRSLLSPYIIFRELHYTWNQHSAVMNWMRTLD